MILYAKFYNLRVGLSDFVMNLGKCTPFNSDTKLVVLPTQLNLIGVLYLSTRLRSILLKASLPPNVFLDLIF